MQGPLLFSLYTRRLSALLDNLGLNHYTYADDTQLYCTFQDDEVQEVKERIISALHMIKSWMPSVKLSLNFAKIKAILFSPKNQRVSMKSRFSNLVLDDTALQLSNEVTILGVVFDEGLTFNSQISKVACSCNFSLHAVQTALGYIPRDVLTSAVTQEVRGSKTSASYYQNCKTGIWDSTKGRSAFTGYQSAP